VQCTLSGSSIIVASEGQVHCDLGGEAVILDLRSGVYYGLNNDVGARIWHLLQKETTVSEVLDALLAEYDVEPNRCKYELLALLGNLADRGLIEVKKEK
jgi:hypothetical protein